MSSFTIAEKIENVSRTIIATQATIDQKRAELEELEIGHRANKRELAQLQSEDREYNFVQSRFMRATRAARKAGLHIRLNIVECCRGCVDDEKVNYKGRATEQPLAWTYGGQGSYLRWDGNGDPYYDQGARFGRSPKVESVLFNHEFNALPILKSAFEAEGFTVTQESEHHCIEVKF